MTGLTGLAVSYSFIFLRDTLSQADHQKEERRAGLIQIADKFGLEMIYVFGSEANQVVGWLEGDQLGISVLPQSDVDIGVKPCARRTLSVKETIDLALVFEDLFGVNRVDLAVIPEVDPFLGANIIRGERIYCRDEFKADEYELYILRRAGDLAPLERERISLIMGEDQ